MTVVPGTVVLSVIYLLCDTSLTCLLYINPFNFLIDIQLVQSHKPAKDKVERVHKEVVIESGPVEYEKTDETTPVGEEDEFDELEEEDEEPVSAVHLMGHLYDASKLQSRVSVEVCSNPR